MKEERDMEMTSRMEKSPQNTKEIIRAWPKVTLLIIANEFCERFCFYGMRSVLIVYFINLLHFNHTTATVLFHTFIAMAYFTPILGSLLADGYIGKFWTILSLSIVYAIGQFTLAFASSFTGSSMVHPTLDFLGLFVIALGTGGIKPCVSSFGADQFDSHHGRLISLFFSMFYFSINAGSLLSIFITPILRSVPCLGVSSCFPLAFGVPAVLMVIATVFFIGGSFWYKKAPPAENVIARVLSTITTALANWRRSPPDNKRDHWLEHAMDTHECEPSITCTSNYCSEAAFVRDVKSMFRVIVMMIPFPMFWALYDQQGSRWTIQALSMDSHVFGNFYLLPDQMQVLNAILILVLIPVFQGFIYPAVERCGIKTTSLRRMAAGGLLAALSFVLCALVQLAVERSQVPPVPDGHAHVSFINAFPSDSRYSCDFAVHLDNKVISVIPSTTSLFDQSFLAPIPTGGASFHLKGNGSNCPRDVPINVHDLQEGESYSVVVTPTGAAHFDSHPVKLKNSNQRQGISIVLDISCKKYASLYKSGVCEGTYDGDIAICREEQGACNWTDTNSFYLWKSAASEVIPLTPFDGTHSHRALVRYPQKEVAPGDYSFYFLRNNDTSDVQRLKNATVKFDERGSAITAYMDEEGVAAYHRTINRNSVSILWQIPQYVVVTSGEVLFSVTGLEFAYSEAAPSLKAVMTALYLLSIAFGDIIIIVIAQLKLFSSMVTEMLVFAAAMLVTIGIFILLAIYYYEYSTVEDDADNEDSDEKID